MRLQELKYWSCSLLLLTLVACEPDALDISIPQAESRLVVASQLFPDQGLVVTLTKSFSALQLPDSDQEDVDSTKADSINNAFLQQFLIKDADVVVTGPDFSANLTKVSDGVFFTFGFPFVPGNTYELIATDRESGKTVRSTTQTLEQVRFQNLSVTYDDPDSTEILVDFQVDDPAGDNYYLVNVYTDSIPQGELFNFTGFSSDMSLVFSDRDYPAGQVNRSDKFYIEPTAVIFVSLVNISKEYFDFIEARKRSDNSFLSEPVVYPSNVENGYGYFNLHFPYVEQASL